MAVQFKLGHAGIKTESTVVRIVRILMQFQVGLQLNLRRERVGTFCAVIWFAARVGDWRIVAIGMSLDVFSEVILKAGLVVTVRAGERFLSGVGTDVVIITHFGYGAVAAVRANQRLLPTVYVHVTLQTELVLCPEGTFCTGKTLLHVALIA